MRSVYIPQDDFFWTHKKSYNGEQFHHLTRVIRLRQNEQLRAFNGVGLVLDLKVQQINSREIIFDVQKEFHYEYKHRICLALSLVKKDAFELALRMSVECGVHEIFPLITQYSEKDFEWKTRHFQIIENAMEQSNHYSYPKLHPALKLNSLLVLDRFFVYMDRGGEGKVSPLGESPVLIVGPEGGWSDEEAKLLQERAFCLGLDFPILRTPTAVVAGMTNLVAR